MPFVPYLGDRQDPAARVVGEVAYTGNYCWVFSDNASAGELNSKLVPEFPDEWLSQFAAGIKILLLVPVVLYGVLQLGSLETEHVCGTNPIPTPLDVIPTTSPRTDTDLYQKSQFSDVNDTRFMETCSGMSFPLENISSSEKHRTRIWI